MTPKSALVLALALGVVCLSAAAMAMRPHHLTHADARLRRQHKTQAARTADVTAQLKAQCKSAAPTATANVADPPRQYQTLWYDQRVDHFNFGTGASYRQKYLVNDTYWTKPTAANGWTGGPIFFYTGNEAPIEMFVAATGQLWELAPQYNALIVFAEHRYYGDSNPFNDPNVAFANGTTLQWLTSEQALADFASLITHIKVQNQANSSAVIAFGGSYGGMLSAWFRVKYPHVVAGSWASSAPILMFPGQVDPYAFARIVTNDFAQANPTTSCSDSIRQSWRIFRTYSPQQLSGLFRACNTMTEQWQIEQFLFPWLANVWVSMAMADYPYSTAFEGAMPPNPVNASCAYFTDGMSDAQIASAVFQAVSVNTNYSGNAQCNDIYDPSTINLLDAGGWSYQICTEMVMPAAQDEVNDMFYAMPFDDAYVAQYVANCRSNYSVTPRLHWVEVDYGSANLLSATNIFLPNGMLDPWSGGGVVSNVSDTVLSTYQPGGAHHFDLRASNPADTPAVIATRQWAAQQITQWIANPAPAIPMYTAPSNAWRTSWVVALSIVCTLAAMVAGHYVYTNYIDVKRPKVDDAPAAAPAVQAGGYQRLAGDHGDEKAPVEPAPSVKDIVASWPPGKPQAGAAAPAPAGATAAPVAAAATAPIASAPAAAANVQPPASS